MPAESKKSKNKHVFVTVGTTEFDDLISTVVSEEVQTILVQKGFSSITLQIGRGVKPKVPVQSKLKTDFYRLKPADELAGDIKRADLVIGHSGAGTCIEVLEARRPLIVCINDSLADNHQIELARQLADDRHLVYCTPFELASTLQDFQSDTLVAWTKGEPKRFASWLDDFVTGKA